MTTKLKTFEECEIVIEYAPVRGHHESILLPALDRVDLLGTLCESKFEQGRIELCVELTEYPDEDTIRYALETALEDAFGEPATKHSTISMNFI